MRVSLNNHSPSLLLSNTTDWQQMKLASPRITDWSWGRSIYDFFSIHGTLQQKGWRTSKAFLTHSDRTKRRKIAELKWGVIGERTITDLNGFEFRTVQNTIPPINLFSMMQFIICYRASVLSNHNSLQFFQSIHLKQPNPLITIISNHDSFQVWIISNRDGSSGRVVVLIILYNPFTAFRR